MKAKILFFILITTFSAVANSNRFGLNGNHYSLMAGFQIYRPQNFVFEFQKAHHKYNGCITGSKNNLKFYYTYGFTFNKNKNNETSNVGIKITIAPYSFFFSKQSIVHFTTIANINRTLNNNHYFRPEIGFLYIYSYQTSKYKLKTAINYGNNYGLSKISNSKQDFKNFTFLIGFGIAI